MQWGTDLSEETAGRRREKNREENGSKETGYPIMFGLSEQYLYVIFLHHLEIKTENQSWVQVRVYFQ